MRMIASWLAFTIAAGSCWRWRGGRFTLKTATLAALLIAAPFTCAMQRDCRSQPRLETDFRSNQTGLTGH